ncbi:MAG TPA: xanthine dehydrogenase accessory protein XdhC [Devosiaceae bacterium]
MSIGVRRIEQFLAGAGRTILVEVDQALGSTPREAGAWMLVGAVQAFGTIGGGQLEFLAIDRARRILAGKDDPGEMSVPLGPDIGQCCGGRVVLSFLELDEGRRAKLIERMKTEARRQPDVLVFGAGHVGVALAHALAPLPFNVTVIDTRRDALTDLPEGVEGRLAAVPEALVRQARPGSAFVILTHDHALDFLIAKEALERGDAAYVGMIGSKSKRATFAGWFRREGGDLSLLDRLVSPIAADVTGDKRPPVIAALAAAEILRQYDANAFAADRRMRTSNEW